MIRPTSSLCLSCSRASTGHSYDCIPGISQVRNRPVDLRGDTRLRKYTWTALTFAWQVPRPMHSANCNFEVNTKWRNVLQCINLLNICLYGRLSEYRRIYYYRRSFHLTNMYNEWYNLFASLFSINLLCISVEGKLDDCFGTASQESRRKIVHINWWNARQVYCR